MKAKQVLQLLRITRPTLSKYVKIGKLKVIPQTNGYYDYDDESVYTLMNKNSVRQNVIYCRVATDKQDDDLQKQKEYLEQYCKDKEIEISEIYMDVSSGLMNDGKHFEKLLSQVIRHKISKVFVISKDRLTLESFDFLFKMFKQFGCEIVVVKKTPDAKILDKEFFDELIPVVDYFSNNVYSSRRKQKLINISSELNLEKNVSF